MINGGQRHHVTVPVTPADLDQLAVFNGLTVDTDDTGRHVTVRGIRYVEATTPPLPADLLRAMAARKPGGAAEALLGMADAFGGAA